MRKCLTENTYYTEKKDVRVRSLGYTEVDHDMIVGVPNEGKYIGNIH